MQKPIEQMRESKEAIDAAPLRSRSDAELYDHYGAVIFAYLLFYTSSQEDAEDLTLEVFTIALEHNNLSELNEKEQLAWLRRVAHHKLVDRYRRLKRRPTVMLEQVQEILRADEVHNPEHIVIRREEVGRLHQAIHNLSVLQQQVLHLRFGAGLRFAQIAVLLNKRAVLVVALLASAFLVVLRLGHTTTGTSSGQHRKSQLFDLHMIDNTTGWASGSGGTVLPNYRWRRALAGCDPERDTSSGRLGWWSTISGC